MGPARSWSGRLKAPSRSTKRKYPWLRQKKRRPKNVKAATVRPGNKKPAGADLAVTVPLETAATVQAATVGVAAPAEIEAATVPAGVGPVATAAARVRPRSISKN
jgi:hypothetical protein